MKVKVDTYRDGGTVSVSDESITFCIDRRIGTQTKNYLYVGHPRYGSVVDDPVLFRKFLAMVDGAKGYENEMEAIQIVSDRIEKYLHNLV